MKNSFILLMSFLLVTTIFSQSFESDRLPIGDLNRKYNFCAVKVEKIFDTKENKELSFDEMIEQLKQKRIVMIGETHTNQLHHDVQFEIIKGLVEAGKPVVLALEMYNPTQNEALAKWSSGKTDPNTFMKQTGFLTSWGHNYRYYKAIFDYAREKHIPLYGANIERKYTSIIGRGGLDSLSAEDLRTIPHIDTSTVEHKFLIKVLMQGMDALMPKQFNNMYPAQSLWDAAMGEGAIKVALEHPEATVVVLAGSGHVIYNLGIGRIIKDRSNLSFASVAVVDISEDKKESGMMKIKKDSKNEDNKNKGSNEKSNIMPHEKMDTDSIHMKDKKMPHANPHSMAMMGMNDTPYRIVIRSYADFLWGKKEMEREKYPAFGFSISKEKENGGFKIKSVFPGTIGYENGLKKGDIILSIDNNSFDTSFELRRYLQFKNWDEVISFNIIRDDENKEVTFTIIPVEDSEK